MDERDTSERKEVAVPVASLTSADSMRAFGHRLAGLLRPGDVILLSGKLGAGKTTLVQGIADGLGIAVPVTSPTFVLLREYEGRLPLRHADLYRLDLSGEITDLGLEELFDQSWVTVVEWGDAVKKLVTACLLVDIDYGAEIAGREIRLRAFGRQWQERLGDVGAALRHATESLTTTTGDDTADSGD